MITTNLLNLLSGFLFLILSPLLLFPDVSLDVGIGQAIVHAGTQLGLVNQIVPVETIFAVVSLFATIEGAIIIFKVFKWVYTKIPGIN